MSGNWSNHPPLNYPGKRSPHPFEPTTSRQQQPPAYVGAHNGVFLNLASAATMPPTSKTPTPMPQASYPNPTLQPSHTNPPMPQWHCGRHTIPIPYHNYPLKINKCLKQVMQTNSCRRHTIPISWLRRPSHTLLCHGHPIPALCHSHPLQTNTCPRAATQVPSNHHLLRTPHILCRQILRMLRDTRALYTIPTSESAPKTGIAKVAEEEFQS